MSAYAEQFPQYANRTGTAYPIEVPSSTADAAMTTDPFAAAYKPSLHLNSTSMNNFPFSHLHLPQPTQPAHIPNLPTCGPIWSATTPFSFKKRTQTISFEALFALDLGRIVQERDLTTLEQYLPQLTYGDVKEEDLKWFNGKEKQDGTASEDDGTGLMHSIHLFRLCQLSLEALLYIQSFLLKSLQAKESATAMVETKYRARIDKDAMVIADYKKQLTLAQQELQKKDAIIAGYERAGARIQPVTYLPASATIQKTGVHQSVYPGEIFTCALCATAFVSPHYLQQHYARRHPGFVHPAQQDLIGQHPRKPHEEEKEYQPPALTQKDIDAQLAAMRARLEEHFDDLAKKRRQQELHAMLTRLNALEALMRSQFGSLLIPKHLLASQKAVYQTLVDEIESIRAELAREAHVDLVSPKSPRWNVQHEPKQIKPQRTITQPSSTPVEVEPPRPQPLVVASPVLPTPAPAPVPVVEPPRPITPPPPSPPKPQPSPAVDPRTLEHLSRLDRLRRVLLSRQVKAYAPWPRELPSICSRYPAEDWRPESAQEQYDSLDVLLRQLALPENQSQLMMIEEEMHAAESAAECYTEIYDQVEEMCRTLGPHDSLVQADKALQARWAFLPTWSRLIAEKEARRAAHSSDTAEREQAAAYARLVEEKQQEEEHMRQEQQRMLLQYESQLARERAAASQPPVQRPPPLRTESSSDAPGVPRPPPLMAQTSEGIVSSGGLRSPISSSDSGLSSPSPDLADLVSPSNTATETGAFDPYASLKHPIAAPAPLQTPAQTYQGARIMKPTSRPVPAIPSQNPAKSPISVVRPEGYEERLGRQPQALPIYTPQTPATRGVINQADGKTPLAVFTPSVRQQQQEQIQPPQQQVIPPQIGGYSPSSSFNSSQGSQGGFGASAPLGSSIMLGRSQGGVGLAHISEGSINESGALNMTQLNRGASGTSRRNSLEQEGKYQETPIPRTEVDEEFEQIISPRTVQPRTQPSILTSGDVTPTAAAASNQQQPAVVKVSSAAIPASNFMVAPAERVPIPTVMPRATSGNSNNFVATNAPPPVDTTTMRNYPETPLSTVSQPGWSTGGGYTPATKTHTYTVAGHQFQFGANVIAPPPSSTANLAQPVPEEQGEEEEDEFPMSSDAQEHLMESRRQQESEALERAAAEALRLSSNLEKRREEEEALGLTPRQQQASQPQAQPQPIQQQQRLIDPTQLNDSVEETIMLDASQRQPVQQPSTVTRATIAEEAFIAPKVERVTSSQEQQQRVLSPSYEQSIRDQDHVTAVTAIQASPSPSSIVSQPGRADSAFDAMISPPPVATTQAFGSSSTTLSVPENRTSEVQPFTPATSFSSNQVQPFVASATSSPVISQPSAPAASSFKTDPTTRTFLADEYVDDFDFDEESTPVQPATTVAASSTTPNPSSIATTTTKPSTVPWMKPIASDDDEADVIDLDDDSEVYGAKEKKTGTSVITPGSVSSARAQLMGSGFFMASPTGAGTPTISQLKAAKAAREAAASGGGGSDDAGASPTSNEPDSSPVSLTRTSKPKPAAARRSRTVQSFTITPKSNVM